MTPERLLSISEAAKLIGIHRDTLRHYCHRGRGPEFQLIGGRRVFTLTAIEEWQTNRPGQGWRKGQSGKSSQ